MYMTVDSVVCSSYQSQHGLVCLNLISLFRVPRIIVFVYEVKLKKQRFSISSLFTMNL